MGFWNNFGQITSINRDHRDRISSTSRFSECSPGNDTLSTDGGPGVSGLHHRKALDLASVQQSVAASGWAEGLKCVDVRDGKPWIAEPVLFGGGAAPVDTTASLGLAEDGDGALYSATGDCQHEQQIDDLDRAAAGDQRPVEKALNIISCAPFFLVGLNTPRASECPKARLYSQSVMGIGAAAMAYHASSGPISRPILHWLDCTMIALSTLCFSRAALPADEHSAALLAVSTAMVPVRPSLVMGLHWSLLEANFWRRSRGDPSLARAHSLHAATAVTAGAAMLADKTVAHHPAVHALWHVVAAGVLHTANALLTPPTSVSS